MAPTASVATSRIVVAWRTLKILRKNLAQNGSHFSTDPESRAEFDVNSTRFVETQKPWKNFFWNFENSGPLSHHYHIKIIEEHDASNDRNDRDIRNSSLRKQNRRNQHHALLAAYLWQKTHRCHHDARTQSRISKIKSICPNSRNTRIALARQLQCPQICTRAPYIRKKRIERLFYFSCIQLDKIFAHPLVRSRPTRYALTRTLVAIPAYNNTHRRRCIRTHSVLLRWVCWHQSKIHIRASSQIQHGRCTIHAFYHSIPSINQSHTQHKIHLHRRITDPMEHNHGKTHPLYSSLLQLHRPYRTAIPKPMSH